jgi:hypothetical protein
MLGCAAIISAPTMACAESLFFDCHGIRQHEPPDRMKVETTEQIMIDPDKGVIEGTGAGGTNEYCSEESDWRSFVFEGKVRLFAKVIRACVNLNIFETAYTFDYGHGGHDCQSHLRAPSS